jgi:beta-galactosidase
MPELPMAHILPHWSWPERVGEVTPVHVFTSGDEGELFLNGKSLGRRKKGTNEYRLRWDDVIYQPGTLKVVTYKAGSPWATASVETAGAAAVVDLTADRKTMKSDGQDLVFVTARVADAQGLTVPEATNRVHFTVEGPGEIVATDNGDATSFEPFPSPERAAFSGLCLAIVRATRGQSGEIKVTATSEGLAGGAVTVQLEEPTTRRE